MHCRALVKTTPTHDISDTLAAHASTQSRMVWNAPPCGPSPPSSPPGKSLSHRRRNSLPVPSTLMVCPLAPGQLGSVSTEVAVGRAVELTAVEVALEDVTDPLAYVEELELLSRR